MCTNIGGTSAMSMSVGATISAPASFGMSQYSAYVQGANYRDGLPFALKQQLKADGYSMDPVAFMEDADYGSSMQFLDVQTGETATYKKTRVIRENEAWGNTYEADHYSKTSGNMSEMSDEFDVLGLAKGVTNGIVVRKARR